MSDCLREPERPLEVHVDHRRELLGRLLECWNRGAAGVVHQNVDAPEGLVCLVRELLALVRVGNVGSNCQYTSPSAADDFRDVVEFRRSSGGKRDVGSGFGFGER
ncbi:MAG: hypothetical protein QOJ80_4415 [Mycobacterium sp.]|nr:hypothetical protein [Mycobacterium sp.]